MLRLRPVCLRFIRAKSSLYASSGGAQTTNKNVTSDTSRADAADLAATADNKLRARPPLVKNFYAGIVDRDLLAFPEVVNREEMQNLQQFNEQLQLHFKEHLNLEPDLMSQLQELNLYAVNISKDYDGKGWNFSGSLMASEPESQYTDIALSMQPHRVLVDVLNEFGTLVQKQRFLPKLTTGQLIGTDAMLEFTAADDGFFNTTAEYDMENKCWELNGEKAFVYNGPMPKNAVEQLFLVFAQTNSMQVHDSAGFCITAFLINGTTPGVSVGELHNHLGARGVQMRRIKFKNVNIPESNVIGLPHNGNQVADALLRCSRLRSSLITLGAAKSTLRSLTQTCIDMQLHGVELT